MDDTIAKRITKIIISCVETVKKKKQTNHGSKITNNFIYVEWKCFVAIFTVRLIYSNWKNKYVSIDAVVVEYDGRVKKRSWLIETCTVV